MGHVLTMIDIVEVAPRDGLQNLDHVVPTATRVELVRRLIECGAARIEVTSFVSPIRVPQMADAEKLMAAVPRAPTVRYSALVANARGARRAVEAGVDEINVVVLATDGFGFANQGADRARMVATYHEAAAVARSGNVGVSVTVGAAFGCPFEGEVPVARVAPLLQSILAVPPDELCLADTIGVGVPTQVRDLASVARDVAGDMPLRFHFHNTRNTGYANAVAAIEAGASALDASTGGIGGCPFAPNATGNIATEDLVYLLDRSGQATGLDRGCLIRVSDWMSEAIGVDTPTLLGRAGDFPPAAAETDRER